MGTTSASADHARLVSDTARLAGLPEAAVTVVPLQEWPLLPSGKPDRQRVAALARREVADARPRGRSRTAETSPTHTPIALASPASVLADVLGRPVADTDSFASLGGDSLSYVEASVRLERVLGTLPHDWHLRPVGTLARDAAPRRRWWRSVETSTLLRALAVVAIVGSHADLFAVVGGAHFLLVLVGFNLGRFALASARRDERVRALLRSVARVVVPSVLWIGGVSLVTGAYPLPTVLLVNSLVGPARWSEPAWYFWFVEALVWCLLALAALLAVPALHRLDLRHPFWFPVGLAVAGLATRYELVLLRDGGTVIHRPEVVWWLVALGWAAARAGTTTHRLVVSGLLLATVPGFFDDAQRSAVVVLAALALVWVRRTPVPAVLVAPLACVAGASLWIYLTHWQVYPHLEVDHSFWATAASLVVGVLAWRAWRLLEARVSSLRTRTAT